MIFLAFLWARSHTSQDLSVAALGEYPKGDHKMQLKRQRICQVLHSDMHIDMGLSIALHDKTCFKNIKLAPESLIVEIPDLDAY